MKKNLAIGLFLAFSFTTSQAQPADTVWHLVNSGIPANISSMQWTTNDTGFFLTNASDLFLTLTTDGGAHFETSKFPDSIVHINGGISHYRTFEQIAGGMSWPTQATGYIAGVTTSDTFGHVAVQTLLATHDAGSTWSQYYPADNDTVITKADTVINTVIVNKDTTEDTTITPADTIVSHEIWSNIYFPNALDGFAATSTADGSKDFIAKTTDGGKTWINAFGSNDLVFGKLNFINAQNGMVFAYSNSDGSNHLMYTTNGGTSFQSVPLPNGIALTALRWNPDSSWLIAIDSSIYRSTDSGKTAWTRVVQPDRNGVIQTMAIHDSIGFVFRQDAPVVLSTRDYGVTWKSDTLPRVGSDSVQALAASMPSDSVAYLSAVDPFTTTNVLMKIKIPQPAKTGNGVVMAPGNNASQFSAAMEGTAILFTAASADRARSIDVMDVLGRACASITLPPGATTSQLRAGTLPPGSYFARLGSAIVKFAVWN
ncbi:MAG: WD40/YVTN/BNR-like repeat-containing protein [Candidatus Kapaibacterium sp.]